MQHTSAVRCHSYILQASRLVAAQHVRSDLPLVFQEDELATNQLSGGISPYMPIVFMKNQADYERFFTFKQASDQERRSWTDCLRRFMRKVRCSLAQHQTHCNSNYLQIQGGMGGW